MSDLSVLFVCLGNICRSPLAEGVFRQLVEEAGHGLRIRVDSAGTGGWHIGEPADSRSIEVARANGVTLTSRARKIAPQDFEEFQIILAMDRQNLRDLEHMRGGIRSELDTAEMKLLLAFSEREADLEVPDPYYGGPDGFQTVFELVDDACRGLLAWIEDTYLAPSE